MKIYENMEAERDRIQACIAKYGHTSDHNLDWWSYGVITPDGKPVFVEWPRTAELSNTNVLLPE